MASHIIKLDPDQVIDKWTVIKKLGEGSFAAVYLVKDPKGDQFALKGEHVDEQYPLLRVEATVMMELKKRNARHLAEMLDKGWVGDMNYIVMKLVGASLQDMKKTGPDRHLSLGCAISVAIQCLEALEDMHNAGYLHRDVKPGNFCTGRAEDGEIRKIYILDYGMSRRYIEANGTIKKQREYAIFRGTPRYAPIASHERKDHGRKDDLESWFYMLVDFTNAKLPWKGVTKIEEIGECKKRYRDPAFLTDFIVGCPMEYTMVLRMIDGLMFDDAPPYARIYELLRRVREDSKAEEFPYNWEKCKEIEIRKPRNPNAQTIGKRLDKATKIHADPTRSEDRSEGGKRTQSFWRPVLHKGHKSIFQKL